MAVNCLATISVRRKRIRWKAGREMQVKRALVADVGGKKATVGFTQVEKGRHNIEIKDI
jgi:hypothetical protein